MSLTVEVGNAPGTFSSMRGLGTNGVTYAPGRNQPGKCTRWVWLALGGFANTTPLPSAVAAWNNAAPANRHPISDTTTIPAGLVVALGAVSGPRWGGDVNYPYGDVCMSTGQGRGLDTIVRCTDSRAGVGVIGDMTIRQRMTETGRPVLGYLTEYGGWALSHGESVIQTIISTGRTTDMAVRQLLHEVTLKKNAKGQSDQAYLAVMDYSIIGINGDQLAALKKLTGLPVTTVNEYDLNALVVAMNADQTKFKQLVAAAK